VLILSSFKFNKLEVLIMRELRVRFRACVDSPEVSAGSGGLKNRQPRVRKMRQLDSTRPPLACAVRLETGERLKLTHGIGRNPGWFAKQHTSAYHITLWLAIDFFVCYLVIRMNSRSNDQVRHTGVETSRPLAAD
jgi:hypothetical protein